MDIKEKKDFKWLVASSLQKCIRRGAWELAEESARWLWEVDRSYLTYRLGIILIEDVGVPGQDLLTEYYATEIKKASIDSAGGLDFMLDIIKRACFSIKDRSACEAYLIARGCGFSEPFQKILNNKTPEEKIKFCQKAIQSNDVYYIDRISAGWFVLGNHRNKAFFLNEYFDADSKSKDDIELFIESWGLNAQGSDVLHKAYLTQREGMCIGYPMSVLNYTPTDGYIDENLFNHVEIETKGFLGVNLLVSSVDLHTKNGWKAYGNFLRWSDDLLSVLKKYDYKTKLKIINAILFDMEGQQVDKRVDSQYVSIVRRDAGLPLINKVYGISSNEFNLTKDILINQIKKLNEFRMMTVMG